MLSGSDGGSDGVITTIGDELEQKPVSCGMHRKQLQANAVLKDWCTYTFAASTIRSYARLQGFPRRIVRSIYHRVDGNL